jgi:beta-N-acetylhexosaminidase
MSCIENVRMMKQADFKLNLPSLDKMTLEQKAAQLVMIDIPDQVLGQKTLDHIAKYAYNGIILFAKNVADRAQLVGLNRALNRAFPITPLLTVDQEGGLVDRFRFQGMNNSPGAMGLSATGDPRMTERVHEIMGLELASLGISLDFAPCLDVNSNRANPIIGVRSFGADAEVVSTHGLAAVRGLQKGGVAACGKHFPGHGDTDADSHIDLPTVGRSREQLDQTELAPFRRVMEAGLDSVMTAHVTFPALDPTPGLPATLSKPILTGLLRQEYGYDGVIFTDSMAMQAIADRFGVGEAAVMSVEAGADIVLACGPFENHIATVEGIIAAVKEGRLTEERLDQSLTRIFRLKKTYCRDPEDQPSYSVSEHQAFMIEVCNKSITALEADPAHLPLKGNVLILMPDMLPQTPLGELNRAVSLAEVCEQEMDGEEVQFSEERFHLHASGDSWRDLSAKAASYDRVVVCLYSRDQLPDGQRALVENLLRDGIQPVVVSLSSPYLFDALADRVSNKILTYNYTPLSLSALARYLLGRQGAPGSCPVPQPTSA